MFFSLRRWIAALFLLLTFTGVGAQGTTAREYVIGPGDVVRINVFQSPDLTLETRVNESGSVTYPLLGQVQLGGLTIVQAEKRIAEGLRSGNFVKQPQVSILIVQVRGNQVSVLGQVNRPGRYPLEMANTKLTDLLAMAGGIAGTGADTIVVNGTRGNKPFRAEVSLPNIFVSGKTSDDIVLQNGDVVYVDRMPTVYIYGEVQRPGALRLERNLTVMQALATGGGLTQRGTERGLRVHRRGPDGKVQVIQPTMEDLLRDGDVVYVRESLF
ncbi:sugar transporter [Caldimonas brevitalea]|uniref:Sugar transporter n=2 Tax=Caldimonas brevitalea TaxID=413882 RepID=A0A0G3BF32_9BURK|nr:sugar transporter [Caldimonas brevitalea]